MDLPDIAISLLADYGLSRKAAARILRICGPAATLRFTPLASDSAPPPVGASRFGGAPDMPASTHWPRRKSQAPLPFIAQINFAECAQHIESGWPADGLLSIFYDITAGPPFAPEDADMLRLLYFPADTPVVRSPADDADAASSPKLPPARIDFEGIVTCPDPDDIEPLEILSKKDIEKYDRFYIEKVRPPRRHGFRHQLGGYPNELQAGGVFDAAINAFGLSDEEFASSRAARRKLEKSIPYWTLLLQLDADTMPNQAWRYGADRLYIWAHQDCIRDRTFNRAWLTIDND